MYALRCRRLGFCDAAALTLAPHVCVCAPAGGSHSELRQPYTWWSDRAEGGGVLGAVGSHLIDLVSFLTGERATSVHCRLSTHVRERDVADASVPPTGAERARARWVRWVLGLCVTLIPRAWAPTFPADEAS